MEISIKKRQLLYILEELVKLGKTHEDEEWEDYYSETRRKVRELGFMAMNITRFK